MSPIKKEEIQTKDFRYYVTLCLDKLQSKWKTIIIFIPFAWLLLFFLTPFFIVAKISLAELVITSPPFQ
jgi:putrescine transport system permease protein